GGGGGLEGGFLLVGERHRDGGCGPLRCGPSRGPVLRRDSLNAQRLRPERAPRNDARRPVGRLASLGATYRAHARGRYPERLGGNPALCAASISPTSPRAPAKA